MDRNLYGTSLAAIWYGFWGGVLLLLGILITFNIQDTFFESTGAPSELTTRAVITGLATLLIGAGVLAIAVGLWLARSWAWWTAVVVGGVMILGDVVNFAQIANDLSLWPFPEFERPVAYWPILMWREQLTFLGSKDAELFIIGWPVLFHLVISFPIFLYLLSPGVRDAFRISMEGERVPDQSSALLEKTRIREPVAAAPSEPKTEATVARHEPPSTFGYLIVQNGPSAGQSFTLQETTRIGRSRQGNEIALDDNAISRQHAIIRFESGKFLYQDRASSNRSYLVTGSGPQELPGRYPLVDGDEILVGETRLVFREGQPGS